MLYHVLNSHELELELQNATDQLVIIDFFADWCGPCKIIDPTLHDLSSQHKDKVKILKVNVDDCEDIAMAYNITSMPTFIFIKNHQIIDILVGGNAEKLAKNVEKYMEQARATLKKSKSSEQKEAMVLSEEDNAVNLDLDVNEPTSMLEVIVDD